MTRTAGIPLGRALEWKKLLQRLFQFDIDATWEKLEKLAGRPGRKYRIARSHQEADFRALGEAGLPFPGRDSSEPWMFAIRAIPATPFPELQARRRDGLEFRAKLMTADETTIWGTRTQLTAVHFPRRRGGYYDPPSVVAIRYAHLDRASLNDSTLNFAGAGSEIRMRFRFPKNRSAWVHYLGILGSDPSARVLSRMALDQSLSDAARAEEGIRGLLEALVSDMHWVAQQFGSHP